MALKAHLYLDILPAEVPKNTSCRSLLFDRASSEETCSCLTGCHSWGSLAALKSSPSDQGSRSSSGKSSSTRLASRVRDLSRYDSRTASRQTEAYMCS